MWRSAWRLFRQQTGSGGGGSRGGGGGGSRAPSFQFGRGRQRIRVRLDGSPEGYVLVAILGACAGYGVGRRYGLPQEAPSKATGKSQAAESASAFGANAVQPYVTPLPSSSSSSSPSSSSPLPPTLPVLTSLTPEEVAAHPLLRAVGPYGLPQLPLVPTGNGGAGPASPPGFHLSPPLLLRHAFLAAYNPKTRTPDWCLEILTSDSVSAASGSGGNGGGDASEHGASRELSHFKPDPFIAPPFQAAPSLFKHSGFDRGHLVPAADVPRSVPTAVTTGTGAGAVAPGWSGFDPQRALDETFVMSNVVPQQAQLNRGYWLQLEHHVRKLARRHGRVFVVSGPLWIPEQAAAAINEDAKSASAAAAAASAGASSSRPRNQHDDETGAPKGAATKQQLHVDILGGVAPGAPFVAVPTHFFKVVLVAPEGEEEGGAPGARPPQLAAFVVPNRSIALSKPLASFQVPLEQVELYAGWQMFARLPRTPAAAGHGHGRRGTKSLSISPPPSPFPAVRDLCAAGGCELKLKDFQFSKQQQTAKAHA